MRRSLRAGAVTLLIVGFAGGLAAWQGGARASTPADDVLDRLEMSSAERRRLARGEVAVYPVEEVGERDLAVGLAMLVPVAMSQLADALATGQLITGDPTISAVGDRLTVAAIAADVREEAEGLAAAQPGGRFNLSAGEIESLRAVARSPAADPRSAAPARVWSEYEVLLRARWRAYAQGGLGAIAPYVRAGGAETDPAAELRRAATDALRVARYGPRLHQALLAYPAAQTPETTHRFYWITRRVQGRPTLTLLHQMVVGGPDMVVHVERYYYVGHSYNAAQIITGVAAHPDGALVFATSRFSTDEVLGIGNALKRAVGRGQLRTEMQKRLERLRDALLRPPALPTQSP